MATIHDGTFEVNMMSSEVVHTRHHIRRVLRRLLILKQKKTQARRLSPRTRLKEKNMDKSEGRALLTIENLKIFYIYIFHVIFYVIFNVHILHQHQGGTGVPCPP